MYASIDGVEKIALHRKPAVLNGRAGGEDPFRRDVTEALLVVLALAKPHNRSAFLRAIVDKLEFIVNARG